MMTSAFTADKACEAAGLFDVEEQSQFEALYEANDLHSVVDKIDYLKKSMKIRAMCCDEQETPEEILAGLEETALLGYLKAYR